MDLVQLYAPPAPQNSVRVNANVRLEFIGDWPFWLGAAAQRAFYNGSMAVLPGLLGYSANYIATWTLS